MLALKFNEAFFFLKQAYFAAITCNCLKKTLHIKKSSIFKCQLLLNFFLNS